MNGDVDDQVGLDGDTLRKLLNSGSTDGSDESNVLETGNF
jgi:hypothetical protein